ELLHVAAEAAAIAFVGHAALQTPRASREVAHFVSLLEDGLLGGRPHGGCQLGLFEHAFSFGAACGQAHTYAGAPARGPPAASNGIWRVPFRPGGPATGDETALYPS